MLSIEKLTPYREDLNVLMYFIKVILSSSQIIVPIPELTDDLVKSLIRLNYFTKE